MNKRPSFIVNVKSKDLLKVESFEINSRGFGKRQSDLRDEDYVSEHDMDMDELADAYKTPIQAENENIVDTSGMSSSQFFVLPRVAEEVIELMDVTTDEKV
ncbi:hypothetical protein L2E82_10861 [Cichorium intybus]|uniref:Uncharacterized protein n=1 Tax=Cichorium intybus TaxID=13427 RepID=A0ACB9GCE6_CICIN|nr:hypothetical protein L2E82_10861 [Cichorium intybus]